MIHTHTEKIKRTGKTTIHQSNHFSPHHLSEEAENTKTKKGGRGLLVDEMETKIGDNAICLIKNVPSNTTNLRIITSQK